MIITDKVNSLTKHTYKAYRMRDIGHIRSIAIHHSATKQGSSEAFANYHVNHNNWAGCGYHYVIDKKGNIDKTNELETVSYHVGNSNREAIGICLIGNFTAEEPTELQLQAAANLCKMLITDFPKIEIIKGHSDYKGYSFKECPAFDVMEITNRMKANS